MVVVVIMVITPNVRRTLLYLYKPSAYNRDFTVCGGVVVSSG